MAVKLEYYQIDPASNNKTKITPEMVKKQRTK